MKTSDSGSSTVEFTSQAKFGIYALSDPLDTEARPFYIGKGRGSRKEDLMPTLYISQALSNTGHNMERNQVMRTIWSRPLGEGDEITLTILSLHSTSEDAEAAQIEAIAHERSLEGCKLTNKTIGGKGAKGLRKYNVESAGAKFKMQQAGKPDPNQVEATPKSSLGPSLGPWVVYKCWANTASGRKEFQGSPEKPFFIFAVPKSVYDTRDGIGMQSEPERILASLKAQNKAVKPGSIPAEVERILAMDDEWGVVEVTICETYPTEAEAIAGKIKWAHKYGLKSSGGPI